MFDFCCILKRRVHVPVAVRVRDPLHRSGGRLSQCDRSVYTLNKKNFLLLSEVFASFFVLTSGGFLRLSLFVLLFDISFNKPEAKAGKG